jgi:DNA-binding transcriptional ArsR family regulator
MADRLVDAAYRPFNQLRKRTPQGQSGPIMSVTHRSQVTPAQLDAAALTFDLLSIPGRLHLVWLLASQELDVTTLAQNTGATIPAASQQLAKLRAAGVVTARRDGRRQLYRVDDPHIVSVIEEMFRHIQPDGTLAPVPDGPRPPRRPRFATSTA